MKTIIVYESRHGFTEKCVGLLAGDLPAGADLWPLDRRPGLPDWADYEAVVFGGPVYFGRWAPRVMKLLNRHPLPADLEVGAFVVSLSPRADALRYFARALPPVLKGRLGKVACFGGGIDWSQLAWWEKFLIGRVKGLEADVSNLDLAEVQALATWLSARTPRP